MNGGVIIVEGNIGAGKSTFAQHLARALDGEYLPEPADGTNPYLEDYYRDPARWAFEMQMFLLTRRYRAQKYAQGKVPLRLVGCVIKPLKADGIDLIITCQPTLERVQRRGFAELPPAIDAEIGAVIHHRLDLRNATGQIDHVVSVGKTGSGDVELFHCIDSIRLNSSPIIGRWITYHNDTLFCEKCVGCFVARLLAFANTPRRSGYRLRRYALLRVPMCSTCGSAHIRHAALCALRPHVLKYIEGIAESYRTQSASYRLPCSPSQENH